MTGGAWGHDAGVWSGSKRHPDWGRLPEGGGERQAGGEACAKQSNRPDHDPMQKRVASSDRREGVVQRAVRDIFSLSQASYSGVVTSAVGEPESSLPMTQNDRRASGSKSTTSTFDGVSSSSRISTNCTPRGAGDGGDGSKSSDASTFSDDFHVDKPSPTRFPQDEQSGYLRIQQQHEGARGERYNARVTARPHDSRRGARPGASCTVELSYMQIYNDRVYDLLSDEANQKPLPIYASTTHAAEGPWWVANPLVGVDAVEYDERSEHEETSRGANGQSARHGSSCVFGLSVHRVEDVEQTLRLLRQGEGKRRVRSTEMNTTSSRSHCIVKFIVSSVRKRATRDTISGTGMPRACGQTRLRGDSGGELVAVDEARAIDPETTVTTRATISLVDLAGSERGGIGECGAGGREWERNRINSSLSALSNFIGRLGKRERTHVPFRESFLTRLLRDALCGAKTVLIATISPTIDAQEESISTLQFAARCTRVVLRQRVNEVVSDALLLERARRQISALCKRLQELETSSSSLESRLTGAVVPAGERGVRPKARQAPAACDDTDEAPGGAKGEPSDRENATVEARRKRRLDNPTERECGSISGSNVLGPREVSQLSAEAVGGRPRRAVGKHDGNDGRASSQDLEKTLSGRRGRDLRTREPSAGGGGRHSVNLKVCCGRHADGMTRERTGPREWERRGARLRSEKRASAFERGGTPAFTTAALIERFACREGDLLREIENWRAKCMRMEGGRPGGDSDVTDVKTACSDRIRSAKLAPFGQQTPTAVPVSVPDKSETDNEVSEAASCTAMTGTRCLPGGERSVSRHLQEGRKGECHEVGSDGVIERVLALDGVPPEPRGGMEVDRRANGLLCDGSTGLFRSNLVGKSPADCDGKVILCSPSPVCGDYSSGAGSQTGSNAAVFAEEGGAADDGGGKLLLKLRAMGNDDSAANRADRDETKPSAWLAAKTDCPGEVADNAEKSLQRSCGVDPCSAPLGPFVLLSSWNTASSGPHEVNRHNVRSTCAGEDGSLPRNLPQWKIQSDFHNHAERSCSKNEELSSYHLNLGEATEKGRSTGIFPTAGEPLPAPAQGCWPGPRKRSLPTTGNNASSDKDDACERHGLSTCVLCSGSCLGVAGGSASLTQPGDTSTGSAGGVNTVACATSGSVGVTGHASYGSPPVVRERPPQGSGGAVIPTGEEIMPCDRHLLPDCILCKIQRGCLGRSAPIQALGLASDGSGKSNAPSSSCLQVSKPVAVTVQSNDCEQYRLGGCLPCGDLDFTAPGRKPDRADLCADRTPLLPGKHLLDICRSSNPSRLLEVYPMFAPRAKGYNCPGVVPVNTGALSAVTPGASRSGLHLCGDSATSNVAHGVDLDAGGESREMEGRIGGGLCCGGAETIEKCQRDNEEHENINVSSSRRSRFPPAAGRMRSGIGRDVSDDAFGHRRARYPKETAGGDLGDATRGIGRGSGERRRRGKSLALRRQPRSNEDDRWPGGALGDTPASVARRREREAGVNNLAARALAAALAVL